MWMYLSVQSVSWFWIWGVVLWRSVSVVIRRMRRVVCGGGMVVNLEWVDLSDLGCFGFEYVVGSLKRALLFLKFSFFT